MKDTKLNSAERLLDAIGDIDARFIAEAQSIPTVKKKPFFSRKAVTAVAGSFLSLALITVISIALVESGFTVGKVFEPEADNVMDGVDRDVVAKDEITTLGDLLTSVQNDTSIKTVGVEDIRFFDDTIKIIWCYEGDENYRMVRVPASKKSEFIRGIEKLKTAPKTTKIGELPYAIWICLEDGRVITPYLEWSDGNIGYAELFEYSPEIEPSSAFTELINKLIS